MSAKFPLYDVVEPPSLHLSFIWIHLVLMLIVVGGQRGMDTAYKSLTSSIRIWDMVSFIWTGLMLML